MGCILFSESEAPIKHRLSGVSFCVWEITDILKESLYILVTLTPDNKCPVRYSNNGSSRKTTSPGELLTPISESVLKLERDKLKEVYKG